METRLREILKEKGLSANAFAAQMGMAPSGLPLNGTFAPTVEKLQHIATHLHVATWELFYDCQKTLAPATEEPDQRIVVQNRITDLLRSKGLSKTETARRMGVSLPSFTLTIKNNMSTKTIEKLCAAISVEPWELFISREDLEREIAERSGEKPAQEPDLFAKGEHTAPAPAATGAGEDLFAHAETEEQEPLPGVTEEERRKFTDFMLTVFEILMKDADKDGVFRLGKYELRMREAHS